MPNFHLHLSDVNVKQPKTFTCVHTEEEVVISLKPRSVYSLSFMLLNWKGSYYVTCSCYPRYVLLPIGLDYST